jgi:acetolactate decarboxylase
MRLVRCLLLVVLLAGVALGDRSREGEGDAVFQTSTINALMAGLYDGPMTLRELRGHGDFGLGTLNGLDGELVELEGRFYQVRIDGRATPVADTEKTPFAVVKQFRTDRTVTLSERVNYTQLEQFLDRALPSRNILYAVRIQGRFDSVVTRSVPRQRPPYPPLAEAVKQQRTFSFRDVDGTVVGFRMPDYMRGLNVPGYHFHFLTADRKAGGHILACEMQHVTLELDEARAFRMALPNESGFDHADLGQQTEGALESVEKKR